MNKPDNIGYSDWNALLDKYNNQIPKEIEEKLNNNYPVQYLIGDVDFLNSKILVNEDVLIPRYETELLVQKTLDKIKQNKIDGKKIIDLCTGSGVIAINLAFNNNSVDAMDVSDRALDIARLNAKNNNTNINFFKSDLLVDDINLNHTLIISNPPYVKYDEPVGKETKYEPQIALFASDNGLAFYKRIISLAKANKEDKYCLAFEIGSTQSNEIIDYAKDILGNVSYECEKDLNGLDRYIFIYVDKCNK